MMQRIQESLTRQQKGMLLLRTLLEEEFSLLMDRRPKEVSRMELSIQELMRQLAVERLSLKTEIKRHDPEAERLVQLDMACDDRDKVDALLAELDEMEQQSAVQAAKNQNLAMGLFDQSKQLLQFLHKEIQPKNRDTYSAKGRFANVGGTQPSLLSGRL